MKSATRERDFFWIALIFCTSALVLLLWTRASDPRWLGHLQIDPVVFQTRAVSFLEHSSWAHAGTNEYQPGALWFFVATACGLEDPRTFDDFRLALASFQVGVHVEGLLAVVHPLEDGREAGGEG